MAHELQMEPHTAFMALACAEAQKYVGATAPNPPVGVCIVKNDQILAIGAHQRAGTSHAEIVAMERAIQTHGKEALVGATLYTTLEPCNHYGKTPPCTKALIEAGIGYVRIAARDPNPHVKGQGTRALQEAGIYVELEEKTSPAYKSCLELIQPFQKWCKIKQPWLVHKLAFRVTAENTLSMIPQENNGTTFTDKKSLIEAHLERRKADAILTGMGTVIKDSPKFNVRHVPDHVGKKRILAILSQKEQTLPSAWKNREEDLGFEVLSFNNLYTALSELGKRGVLRVLVEAGPNLSKFILNENLWDEKLVFIHPTDSSEDIIYREYACSQALLNQF